MQPITQLKHSTFYCLFSIYRREKQKKLQKIYKANVFPLNMFIKKGGIYG